MKAVVAAFNQEKSLVGAFSVITNLRMELFQALEQAQCIIDQYSEYKLPGIQLAINGRMTQGENIADNGGLKQVGLV